MSKPPEAPLPTVKNDFSLIIPVYEAADLQAFRQKHLHRPAVVMPPHITVPAPFESFLDFDSATQAKLRATLAAFPSFAFALHGLNRFMPLGVLYLEPEPITPFLHLHQTLCDAFQRPYAAAPVFHLTLAGWHAGPALDSVEAEFLQRYGPMLPIRAKASELWLYEQVEGVWQKRETFELRRSV